MRLIKDFTMSAAVMSLLVTACLTAGSLFYVLVKGSWLIFKHVWGAGW